MLPTLEDLGRTFTDHIPNFRTYVRKLVWESVNEWFNSVRREALADIKQTLRDQLGHSFVRREIHTAVGESYRLLDESFSKPTSITAYLDLRALERSEEARVGLFIGIRGDRDEDLVQVAANRYEGPMEDAVVVGPFISCGRTILTYKQLTGEVKPIWIQIYTSAVHPDS